ncbi:MAG: HAD-IIB family hydrolase [Clostridia bacterium]|nr:HAD-IIB family hydrolase [Clostridia bacterium]
MIRLVATDLDGTLLDENGRVPARTVEVVRTLKRMGIRFAASSGRQHGNLVRLFGEAADDMSFVCENGAVNIADGQVAGVIPIPAEMVSEAIDDLEAIGMNILISARHTCYMVDRNRRFTDDIVYRLKNTITIIESWDQIKEPILKISGQIDTGVKDLAPALLKKWSHRLTATESGRDWFDMTAANKGMGMQMLMNHLGILPEETMAFGDNFNDESMFDCVGYPFLMEHANHTLRKPGIRLCSNVLSVIDQLVRNGGDPQKAFR